MERGEGGVGRGEGGGEEIRICISIQLKGVLHKTLERHGCSDGEKRETVALDLRRTWNRMTSNFAKENCFDDLLLVFVMER